jgi:acetyl-CoA C-acetyltransferase
MALSDDKFNDELAKINFNGNILNKDEHPRFNLKITDLEKLKTVFMTNGTVTAGNSSGINDGAAGLLLTSFEQAEKKSIKPLAKIVSWASVGVDPSLMGLGPIEAVREAVRKAKWNLNEIDLFEINEAFAAQSIAVIRELGIEQNKVNVNGGAIALGHPIGASGARILVTLVHEMKRQKKNKGCATLCIGGGMGIALCIERI